MRKQLYYHRNIGSFFNKKIHIHNKNSATFENEWALFLLCVNQYGNQTLLYVINIMCSLNGKKDTLCSLFATRQICNIGIYRTNMLLQLRSNFFDIIVIISSSQAENTAKGHSITLVAVMPSITYKTGVPNRNAPVTLLA